MLLFLFHKLNCTKYQEETLLFREIIGVTPDRPVLKGFPLPLYIFNGAILIKFFYFYFIKSILKIHEILVHVPRKIADFQINFRGMLFIQLLFLSSAIYWSETGQVGAVKMLWPNGTVTPIWQANGTSPAALFLDHASETLFILDSVSGNIYGCRLAGKVASSDGRKQTW